jgi:hypothetical protein
MNVRPEPWTTPCTGKETQQIKKNNNDDTKVNDDFQLARAKPAGC